MYYEINFRKKEINIKKSISIVFTLILSSSLLAACSNDNKDIEAIPPANNPTTSAPETPHKSKEEEVKGIKSQYSDNRYGTKLDKINEEETKRASIQTDYGKLYIITKGIEEISRFEAPNSFGGEGYAFRGDYNLILDKDGEKKVITELKDFSFVQSSENAEITFDKVSFETIDLFLVTPEYRASRGKNSYAVAINKETGESFQVTFRRQGVERNFLNYANLTEAKPKNENGKLVIQTRYSEKATDIEQGLLTVEYSFDKDKKMFIAK